MYVKFVREIVNVINWRILIKIIRFRSCFTNLILYSSYIILNNLIFLLFKFLNSKTLSLTFYNVDFVNLINSSDSIIKSESIKYSILLSRTLFRIINNHSCQSNDFSRITIVFVIKLIILVLKIEIRKVEIRDRVSEIDQLSRKGVCTLLIVVNPGS